MTPEPLVPVAPAARDPLHVFVGLPIPGDPLYDLSRMVADLESRQWPGGWRFTVRKVGNQGLAKGRNILTFLARCSGAGQMVMIDGDVQATAAHVLRLCAHPELVVGALYPKKEIPIKWVGEFKPVDPAHAHPHGLWPMLSVGTGLLKVRMETFDRLLEQRDGPRSVGPLMVDRYESEDNSPAYGLRAGDRMHDFWVQRVEADQWFARHFPRYLTEDYGLSWLCRRAGIDLWTDPGCQVGHVGRCDYPRRQRADRRGGRAARGRVARGDRCRAQGTGRGISLGSSGTDEGVASTIAITSLP